MSNYMSDAISNSIKLKDVEFKRTAFDDFKGKFDVYDFKTNITNDFTYTYAYKIPDSYKVRFNKSFSINFLTLSLNSYS